MSARLNADFSRRVVLDTGRLAWQASPLPGVERRMLDRVGDEVARATSIVRYAPGSAFSAHTHERGEEFLVLEGVFSDEHGDFPAGSYVRNPPGSSHAPHSARGCTIFVKLRQFDDDDGAHVVMDTGDVAFSAGRSPGVSTLLLHEHRAERVCLLRLEAGARVAPATHPGGEEILVLEGAVDDAQGRHGTGVWIRNPPGSRHGLASEAGAVLYVKTGHLPPTDV